MFALLSAIGVLLLEAGRCEERLDIGREVSSSDIGAMQRMTISSFIVFITILSFLLLGIVCRALWATTEGFPIEDSVDGIIQVCAAEMLTISTAMFIMDYTARRSCVSRLDCLLAFSVGVITWHIVGRVLPVYQMVGQLPIETIVFACIVLLLVLSACSLTLRILLINKADGVIRVECSPNEPIVPSYHTEDYSALTGFPLTEREKQIACETLAGLSSKQIAIALSISSSTVRNHLARIYRKVGVASRREFLEVVRERRGKAIVSEGGQKIADAPPKRGTSTCRGSERSSYATLRSVQQAVTLLLITASLIYMQSMFFPHESGGDWGYGKPVVAAASLALLLFAVFQRSLDLCLSNSVLRSISCAISCVLLGASCAVQMIVIPGDALEMGLHTRELFVGGVTLILGTMYGFGFLNILMVPDATLIHRHALAFGVIGSSLLTLFCRGLDLLTARFFSAFVVVALCMSILAIQFTLRLLIEPCDISKVSKEGDEGHKGDFVNYGVDRGVIFFSQFGVSLFLGLFFEELWRAAGSVSYVLPLCLPAALVVLVMLLASGMILGYIEQLIVISWIIPSVLMSTSLGELLFLVLLVLLMRWLAASWCSGVCQNLIWAGALGFTAGAVAGDIGVNLYGDELTDLIRRVSFEGSLSFQLIVACLFGAFVLGMLILVVALAVYIGTRMVGHDHADKIVSAADRVDAFLAYRGLSATQRAVLAAIAQGKTGSEIANELHLSMGTVNSARAAGYEILGIHSRMGLLRVLISNLAL